MHDWSCEKCGFELYFPVKVNSLSVTHLGLYADAKFRGRAILAYTGHVEHLEQLSDTELSRFWADTVRVGRALRAIVGATRVNYAVLCNAQRHLHVHVIPRRPDAEPLPTRSPWSDTRPSVELSTAEYESLSGDLRRAIGDRST